MSWPIGLDKDQRPKKEIGITSTVLLNKSAIRHIGDFINIYPSRYIVKDIKTEINTIIIINTIITRSVFLNTFTTEMYVIIYGRDMLTSTLR